MSMSLSSDVRGHGALIWRQIAMSLSLRQHNLITSVSHIFSPAYINARSGNKQHRAVDAVSPRHLYNTRTMRFRFTLVGLVLGWCSAYRGFQLPTIPQVREQLKLDDAKQTMKTALAAFVFTASIQLPMVQQALAAEPSDSDNRIIQMAFKDFDERRFAESDKEFTMGIERWRQLDRPRDEIVSLLKARANVRLDFKEFDKSLSDCNEEIELMKTDAENADGTGKYPEYADAYVQRALAKEGLADWSGALQDYDKAISLWGGGRGEGVNPYVLTFRGNTLCRIGKFADAVPDYEAASDRFIVMRDVARYSDARANLALALYEIGSTQESVKAMNDVVRKNPGYADMHVALAANNWGEGNYINAMKEWNFACDRIDVGCSAYKDRNWLTTVRRWPPSLVKKLDQFLAREIPDKLQGDKSQGLAPSSASSM